MPDFKEVQDIILQPLDVEAPYSFSIPACTSATANDGGIPYDTTIASVVVTAHKQSDGSDVSSEIVDSSSVSDNIVSVALNYPSTSGVGTYHLRFALTLDNSDASVIEKDFNRVKARNK